MPEAVSQSDGVRIHFEVEGSQNGSPLVVLPGAAGSVAAWRLMGYPAAFADRHFVISIDPRGHGESDKPIDPTSYGLVADVADVLSVLDEVEIASAHVFGYSMGARIAVALGAHDPGRVRSVIAGGPPPLDPSGASPSAGFASTEAIVGAFRELYEARGVEFTAAYEAAFGMNDVSALDARNELRERDKLDLTVTQPTCPVLVYAGDGDQLVALVDQYASLIEDARTFVVEGADHVGAALISRHPLISETVRAFLSEVDADY